jgi:hypothetical protein
MDGVARFKGETAGKAGPDRSSFTSLSTPLALSTVVECQQFTSVLTVMSIPAEADVCGLLQR